MQDARESASQDTVLGKVEGSRQPGRPHEGGLMIYWSGTAKTSRAQSWWQKTETSGEDSWLAPTGWTVHGIKEEEEDKNQIAKI